MNDDKLNAALGSLPSKVEIQYASCKKQPELPEGMGGIVLGCDMDVPLEAVVVLSFSEPGFGFGEITLIQTPAGVFLDTECMNLDRVKKYFMALLDSAITDREEDPTKHALYNQETGTRCGEGCSMCFPVSVPE